MHITREVVLDADLDEVWNALIDRDQRADWLDDDRPLQILHVDTGRSLTWRWSAPDPQGVESTVDLELEATEDGRTRLTVVERATAATRCTLDQAVIDVDAWDRRLLGLELRCMVRATAPALV
jgi:uncharacterized protein YndB with AHSA1/START domain